MEKDANALAQVRQYEEVVEAVDVKEIQQNLQNSCLNGYVPSTPEEKSFNRALNRRLDLFLMGFCALIYIFNGLDRSNLGNAQTGGLSKDLGLNPSVINEAASLFYATYIPFAPVSTVIGKKVGQARWLGIIGVLWGVTTIATAFVKTRPQLLVVRILLGLFETGLYPTVMSYLSVFYPRYDVAFRIAMFYSCYAIATAFGGLIAYGCFHINGSLFSWQYLFIIEGACSVLIALVTPFWLPKDVGSAWFLTEQQREFGVRRMHIDSAANASQANKITKRDIMEGILDWKLYFLLLPNICQGVTALGLTTFFPIVVQALGYTGATANLMTVPPYVAGCVVGLTVSYLSDHYRRRLYGLLGALIVSIAGLSLTVGLPLDNYTGRYGGLVLLVAGSFIGSPLQVSWLSGNTPEPGMRVVVLGINGWGNFSGLIGSQIFLSKYGPSYRTPLLITLGLAIAGFLLFIANAVVLQMVNRRRAKIVSRMTPEEIAEENASDKRYGDKKVTFVYGW
ncbi:hypothetical protein SBRCBS47491_010102 [Sporothrix bragantina]|uniref:Major facilitator superfamily (MFS) profile domain-containing protein n=1 Tax=Sporothrix bragantina TaxID=671064 RepID=A0ABP0D3N5_9PEZI